MSEPQWYIPYAQRAGLPAEEVADSQQWDDDNGVTARRIRESDRASREWQATHPKPAPGCAEFDEDVDDMTMCMCGVPALVHR